MKTYRIQVVRFCKDYQLLDVQALSESSARKIAIEKAKQNPDDFCDTMFGRIQVVEVEEVKK